MLDIIKDHGIPPEQIEKQTGIASGCMYDADVRITIDQFLKLWQMAEDVTGDPAIGLHLRKNYGTNIMHFVVRLATNSKNLLESTLLWSRYATLICEMDRIDLFDQGENFLFVYTNTSPMHENRWVPEHHFSLSVDCSRAITRKALNPIEVWFKHEDPGYREEYEKIFQCPVYFNKNENILKIRRQDILQPIVAPDPYLRSVLKKHADQSLKRLHGESSLARKVRGMILSKLPTGTLTSETIAKDLNMDRSTLHRHLKKEGVLFKDLLVKTRQDLAKKYLLQGLTASQTGYLIGFSEPSTFQRAFKAWFGKSPGEYKKTITQNRTDS